MSICMVANNCTGKHPLASVSSGGMTMAKAWMNIKPTKKGVPIITINTSTFEKTQ